MAVQLSSSLAPKGTGKYALLDDKWVKGGLRVFPTTADLTTFTNDLLLSAILKVGGLATTADNQKLWIYLGSKKWAEYKPQAIYKHVQQEKALEWTIVHNMASKVFTFNVQDTNGESYMPSEILSVDDTTIKVVLPTELDGTCMLVFAL